MISPDDLVKRLRGLNNNFAITDLGLCRIYEEAAATLEAQAAEILRLREIEKEHSKLSFEHCPHMIGDDYGNGVLR
jgi:hypothetical protein